ncbi:hypothetical protein [Mesoplasma tabanidae]|uniref:Glycosyl hydrolase family 32 N-terminal domain-containing protein n=1 Tax=Mesoplasma tabanidae TaxID=219745 RepID=A0A2K8P4M4_9MOLU|nr:hypothetical protein [Mesoplasma tabanidae]ATZ21701.1 hypothetical protein MTABA_v1c05030 [Mesoplasma tabanidae]
MIQKIVKRKTMLKGLLSLSAASIVIAAPLSVVSCEKISYNDGFFDRPVNWYSPFNSKTGSSDAFANDACSILWDEEQELFYSWMLFRDGKGFPSGWIEMTSPDLNTWTQGKYRVKHGSEFENINNQKNQTSALGGSVWVDTKGQFFDQGDVVFVISMQPSKILTNNGSEEIGKESNIESKKVTTKNDYTTDESGIAYFVSHGLGQDFYTSGVLSKECLNKDGTLDWRDTAVFETDDGVYFAISAHDRLEFWKINHFGNKPKNEGTEKITKVSELFVRNIGVEVPNVVRVDNNLWYVSASVQDNPFGGPFQSAWWTLCEWDKKDGFIPVYNVNGKYERYDMNKLQNRQAAYEVKKEQPHAKVIDWSKSEKYKDLINPWTPNEYGTEGYAQRVVNPYQTQLQKAIDAKKAEETIKYDEFLIARSMTSNWAYNTDIWSWKGGTYGSERIQWNKDRTALEFLPNDKIAGYSDNGTAVYYLKGENLEEGYTLKFDGKNFTFKLEFDENKKNGKVTWNNQLNTGLKKWTNQGGPTEQSDEIIIVWNKSTLTFYNRTKNWNAHFMLPQGTTHTKNENAKSIV